MWSTAVIWSVFGIRLAVARTCQNFIVQVSVEARNGVFGNIVTPATDLEATSFISDATRRGVNATAEALTGYATVSGRYNISAQYCKPRVDRKNYTLQILTHGVGFDKTYWDLPYHNYNYSYVDYALSHGYHTFSYDRLGIGLSSHGDPKNEIQIFPEIEALAELTRMLRGGVSHDNVCTKPEKVVHVGHSFGSVTTFALSAMYPHLSDAIVLTGFSSNADNLPTFLAGGNFKQARLLKSSPSRTEVDMPAYQLGYLANADAIGIQYQFFHYPEFDPGLLEFSEVNKQPATIGELMTQGGVPKLSNFSGPVFVITGSNDEAFCGGNCYNGSDVSIPAATKDVFPFSRSFDAFVQPETGHGVNLHYTATEAYQQIHRFLAAHGFSYTF